MKKFTTIALAVGLALLLATPAMAVETTLSGQFQTAGHSYKDIMMSSVDKNQSSASYYNMKFDLKGKIKVSDNISLTTDIRALDRDWGDADTPAATAGTLGDTNNADDNVRFRAAYATIKTPIGGLLAGRFVSTPWGTPWADSEGENDQIVYVLPLDQWTFAAVIRKEQEWDGGAWNNTANNVLQNTTNPYLTNGKDNDKYFVTAKYKKESIEGGILVAKYQLNNYVDENYAPIEAGFMVYDPYFILNFGGLRIQGEGVWGVGTARYTEAYVTNAQAAYAAAASGRLTKNYGGAGNPIAAGAANPQSPGSVDRDIEAHMYNIEAAYTMGPVTFGGGYAKKSGMICFNNGLNPATNTQANKLSGIGWLEKNQDWGKGFILNNFHDFEGGGVLGQGVNTYGTAINSNNSQSFSATAAAGMKAFYIEGSYSILENLAVSALWMTSKADKVRTGWGDDHGDEIDVTLTWKPMDNLEYKAIFATLNAGDYWKGDKTATTEVKDPVVLYHALTITF